MIIAYKGHYQRYRGSGMKRRELKIKGRKSKGFFARLTRSNTQSFSKFHHDEREKTRVCKKKSRVPYTQLSRLNELDFEKKQVEKSITSRTPKGIIIRVKG